MLMRSGLTSDLCTIAYLYNLVMPIIAADSSFDMLTSRTTQFCKSFPNFHGIVLVSFKKTLIYLLDFFLTSLHILYNCLNRSLNHIKIPSSLISLPSYLSASLTWIYPFLSYYAYASASTICISSFSRDDCKPSHGSPFP